MLIDRRPIITMAIILEEERLQQRIQWLNKVTLKYPRRW
jgi:hypothetical protein